MTASSDRCKTAAKPLQSPSNTVAGQQRTLGNDPIAPMNYSKITAQLLTFPILLSSAWGSMLLLAPGAAQAQTPTPTSPKSRAFSGFLAPPGKEMPSRTEGGASRGSCMDDLSQSQQAVQLITPASNSGLTAAKRPVFMAHIKSSKAHQLFFSLKNADESYFYEMTMSSPAQGGLVKFELPASAPELQVGEEYRWSVAIICGSRLGPDSPWASGWVERVEPGPEVANLSQSLSLVEQASVYGQAGLWYETAAALAEWKAEDAQAAGPAWNSFLQAAGLDKISQKD